MVKVPSSDIPQEKREVQWIFKIGLFLNYSVTISSIFLIDSFYPLRYGSELTS